MRLDGIILAAGASRRMGRAKAALTLPCGVSFLRQAAQTLLAAGCDRVLVVVNAEAELPLSPTEVEKLELVVNRAADAEQIDSLRRALERLDDATEAVLVLPVDLPLISPATAAVVATSFRERAAPIVVPAHDGVAGHPILLARRLFDEILRGDWEEGLRSVLVAHAHETLMVPVNDPGIVIDIDTPEDYVRHVLPQ